MDSKNVSAMKDETIAELNDQLNQVQGKVGGMEKSVKKAELQLRQIKDGKMKDLQREIKRKNQEINELQGKVQGLIYSASDTKDFGSRSKSFSKNGVSPRSYGRNGGPLTTKASAAPKRRHFESVGIAEVPETLENTGNHDHLFEADNMFEQRPAMQDYRDDYRTPQKLPAIPSGRMNLQSESSLHLDNTLDVAVNHHAYSHNGGSAVRRNRRNASRSHIDTSPVAKATYAKAIDTYTNQLKSPRFYNNSEKMNGIFGTMSNENVVAMAPTRADRMATINQQLSKISHLI